VDEDFKEVNSTSSMSGNLLKMGAGISPLWGRGFTGDCMLGHCRCCLSFLLQIAKKYSFLIQCQSLARVKIVV